MLDKVLLLRFLSFIWAAAMACFLLTTLPRSSAGFLTRTTRF